MLILFLPLLEINTKAFIQSAKFHYRKIMASFQGNLTFCLFCFNFHFASKFYLKIHCNCLDRFSKFPHYLTSETVTFHKQRALQEPTLCPPQLGCFVSCTPEFATKVLEMEKNLDQAEVFMTFFMMESLKITLPQEISL